MAKYFTKLSHARITLSPFTSEQMADIGDVVLTSIKDRIVQAVDTNDNQAKPLTDKYAKRKMKYGRSPVRDWTFTGRTLGSLKVKSANENKVRIGAINERADMVIGVQNRANRLWGLSPKDDAVFRHEIVRQLTTKKMAKVEAA